MKKILFVSGIVSMFALALVSCNKSDPTSDPAREDPEAKITTATLYVPYYEDQLEYLNCEYTVNGPDGKTETVILSKSTAKDDSSNGTKDLRDQVKKLADLSGVTDVLKVFKVCSFEVRENETFYVTCKFCTAGTFKTDGTEFNMVTGGSWFTQGGSGSGKETVAHIYKGVYTDETNLTGFIETINSDKKL